MNVILKGKIRPFYNFFLKVSGQLFHRGKKYICPFCGFLSNDLILVGGKADVLKKYEAIGAGRRRGSCWNCQASDKEKLLYIYLRDYAKIFDGSQKSILHIAPEFHLSNQILRCKNITYTCGDLFAEGYTYPNYVQYMDLLDLQLTDNIYDIVICAHVLEHIPDDKKAMSEIFRVLKPNGFAIIQVPLSKLLNKTLEDITIQDPKIRYKLFGQKDHYRLYAQCDYIKNLKDIGFEVEVRNISVENMKYGLNPMEDLYICHKK